MDNEDDSWLQPQHWYFPEIMSMLFLDEDLFLYHIVSS